MEQQLSQATVRLRVPDRHLKHCQGAVTLLTATYLTGSLYGNLLQRAR
jgi:hypothetical protein